MVSLVSSTAQPPTTVATATVAAVSKNDLKTTLQAIIDKHASFWNVSISFAVYNGTTDVAVAGGVNDFQTGTPLSPLDRVPSGSTTKFYTAVSVLRLAQNGTLHLDQPVAPLIDRYLAQKMPCTEQPKWCTPTCLPVAHCLVTHDASCKHVDAALNANCSYCLRASAALDPPNSGSTHPCCPPCLLTQRSLVRHPAPQATCTAMRAGRARPPWPRCAIYGPTMRGLST